MILGLLTLTSYLLNSLNSHFKLGVNKLKRLGKYFAIFVPLLVFVGILFVFGIMLAIVSIITSRRFGVPIDYIMNSVRIINIYDVIFDIIIVIVFFMWYRRLESINRSNSFVKNVPFRCIGILILLGLGEYFICSGAVKLILPHFRELYKSYTELMKNHLVGNPIFIFISVVIVTPVCEELIFRGVIFHKARAAFPIIPAIIIQAVLFGFVHLNIIQGLYAFAGGILLGYVAYKFRSLLAPILVHMVFNASDFLLIDDSTLFMQIMLIVVGTIMLAFTLYIVHRSEVFKQPDIID